MPARWRDASQEGPGGPGFRDDARRVRLAGLQLREGERFTYEYDFSAAWRVDLRVEQIAGAQPGRAYPGRAYLRCTGGRRAGPPEDWDGPWAFLERTQPRLVFGATMRAAKIIGQLPGAGDQDPEPILVPGRYQVAAFSRAR